MHIAWLRRDVNDIRNELQAIRGEIKDVRGEMKDIRQDMQTDFRLMFSALIGIALSLACIMAQGFHWLWVPVRRVACSVFIAVSS